MERSEPNSACGWVLERIEDAVDGELSTIERQAFEAHLSQCAGCRNEYALAQDIQQALAALPELPCPNEVMERVRGRVCAQNHAVLTLPLNGRFWHTAWFQLAAAMLLLTSGLCTGYWLQYRSVEHTRFARTAPAEAVMPVPSTEAQTEDRLPVPQYTREDMKEAARQLELSLGLISAVGKQSAAKVGEGIFRIGGDTTTISVLEKALNKKSSSSAT